MNVGGDSLEITGFLFGDLVIGDDFARESIPKEDFAAVWMGGESLATGDDFVDFDHSLYYSIVGKGG